MSFHNLRKIILAVSDKASVIGGIALFGMIAVTCIDVIGTKVFKKPLIGSYEIVFLAQIVAIALSSTDTLIYGRHVHVEMFVLKLPGKIRRITACFVSILGLLLFAVLSWQGFLYAKSLKTASEVTGTLKIPLYPFAFVLGISGVLVCLVYIVKLLELLKIIPEKDNDPR